MGLSKLYSVGPRSGADPMLQARALDEKIDRQWWMGSDAAQNPTSFAEIERNQQSGLLSVVGLDLPPGLVKQVVDGLMGWSSDPDQCQRTAAALGYVAHMVHLLGLYLDVPPRFPIYPKGSRSLIYNCAPAEDHMDVQGNGWLTSGPWRKSPTSPGRPVAPEVFPLYYQGTDRSRFAYAIYLLDKDIEQLLNAHGIKPTGPSYVLQSFYSLVAAASSALSNPGLWPSCQRRS
ncbi:unnamed protein product [Ostreobium quekettii]|uniref:Uncharacterized protein n=1 Tax=Ostreobium quekettii TaxID=121088 RepID=A0A8S1IQM4_9CHLO|nr:unnamed protein product [Ostreobium quekettii]